MISLLKVYIPLIAIEQKAQSMNGRGEKAGNNTMISLHSLNY